MSFRLRKIVTWVERKLAPIIGQILWPPVAANVLCWTDKRKEKAVVLEVDGDYSLPAGMIKQGEHPEETAKREFKEETNLKISLNQLLGIKTYWKDIEAIHIFYEATLEDNFENSKQGWEGKPQIVDRKEIEDIVEKLPQESSQ